MQRDYRAKNVFARKRWNDYKNGFEEAGNAYWLGLQKMHEKTSKGEWEFALVYQGCNHGQNPCAVFKDFKVDSEKANFKLYLGQEVKNKFITYLKYHNNMPFTTIDRDNDKWYRNCAADRGGGWWMISGCTNYVCPTCGIPQPIECTHSYIVMK